VIKQIGLPLRGRPISLNTRITRMITDRIGLHSVLLPLLIIIIIIIIIRVPKGPNQGSFGLYSFTWVPTCNEKDAAMNI